MKKYARKMIRKREELKAKKAAAKGKGKKKGLARRATVGPDALKPLSTPAAAP